MNDAPAGFEPINLDGFIGSDELVNLSAVYSLLSAYAAYKVMAMNSRRDGFVGDAITLENKCDRIYKQLPDWARW